MYPLVKIDSIQPPLFRYCRTWKKEQHRDNTEPDYCKGLELACRDFAHGAKKETEMTNYPVLLSLLRSSLQNERLGNY